MRCASLILATEQGLGILARDFVKHGVVTDPIIVYHGRRPTHREWYPNAPMITDLKNPGQIQEVMNLLADVDTLLIFETPFVWTLIPHCRHVGTKTVLMPMFECMPRELPFQPDKIINPSLLDQRYYPQGEFIPVPVPDEVTARWRRREIARTFVHNAGHGGLKGRNGTAEVLAATELVKSPAEILIRSQGPFYSGHALIGDPYKFKNPHVKVQIGTVPAAELYAEGEVFLFPEKFNGLSLPLQEAYASGMLVMCGERFPMTTWLPNEPMIPLSDWRESSVGGNCNRFEEAVYDPTRIAEKIDEWYGKNVAGYSERGLQWAMDHSWEALKPHYMKALTP